MAGSGRTWTSAALVAALITLGGTALTSSAASPGASTFVPITPCRLFDTRTGLDNVGPRDTPVQANETYTVEVWGTNGDCTIPADATGVTMNVAIVNPTGDSFLTVYPGDASRPLAANLNWVAGQAPTPNAVTAALGADGTLAFYNLTGTVDLAVDINGYYEAVGPAVAPGPDPERIVWVAKSGGDFTSLSAAMASITDASASKRYVIKVAPGDYTEPPITVKSFVDVQGSGPATVLRCDCPGTQFPNDGPNGFMLNVSGVATTTTVSDLAVVNVGGADVITGGIRTVGTAAGNVTFRNVSVTVTGAGTVVVGIAPRGGATILDSTISVTGSGGASSDTAGISTYQSGIVLERVSVSVTSSSIARGISTVLGSVEMRDSTVAVFGTASENVFGLGGTGAYDVRDSAVDGAGGATAWAAYFSDGGHRIHGSTLRGDDVAVEMTVGPHDAEITSSILSGVTSTVRIQGGNVVQIASTGMYGGASVPGGGTLQCALVHDENWAANANTCF